MRVINNVTISYLSATGEELTIYRGVGNHWGTPKIDSIRIRWAGGAGGTFRLYMQRPDGTLSTIHIPQERIVNVQVEYEKQVKK